MNKISHKQGRLSHLVLVFGVVLGIVIVLGTVLSLTTLRQREIDTWRQQLNSMSLTLAKNTAQTIFAGYLVLDSVAEHVKAAGVVDGKSLRSRMGTAQIYATLVDRIHDFPQLDVVTVVAANGDVINFTRTYPASPINLADRDYFKAHQDNPHLGDFISASVHNKGNGKWTFYLSRRLNDPQGRFLGLVLVGLSVDAFTQFFSQMTDSLGKDASISLYRDDLNLLARAPQADEKVGKINLIGPAHEAVERIKQSGVDGIVLNADSPRFTTGQAVPRLVAVRKAERYPVYVSLIVEDKIYLATWRRSAYMIVGIATGSLLLLVVGVTALGRTVAQRETAERAMRESKARLRANLANTPNVAVQWYDETGRVTYWNPASEKLFGWSSAEAVGKTLDQLMLSAEEAAEFQRIVNGIRANGQPYGPYEVMTHDRVGRSLWLLSTTFAIPMGQDRIGFACMDIDITARKDAEAQLEAHRQHLETEVAQRTQELTAAKDAAEAANLTKSSFLANMSHEIRTPLNAITGMAYLIRRAGLSAKQEDQMRKLETASTHLLEVINAVLELSKIEAGKFALEEKEVSIVSMVANVCALLQPKSDAKHLTLRSEISSLPLALLGDATRLQQALLNFAANAVKFTYAGSIVLRVCCLAEQVDRALIRFEVCDTGIGIPPVAMPRLFAAFEQADNSLTRQYGGTGLGLAITKKIAQHMGGDAGAESIPGQGSTFWFTASLKKAKVSVESEDVHPEATAEAILQRAWRDSKVLLVEDEPINREIVLNMLEHVRLRVDFAEDGAMAVRLAADQDYAAILMDMQMPVMDGLEATRQIRKHPRHVDTPIIAITANAFAEDRERCLAAGMNDFLAKPVVPEVFYATLLKWLLVKDEARTAVVMTASEFAWSERYSVGVPVLDEQHRRLLALCQRAAHCLNASGEQSAVWKLEEVLDEMRHYADEHFKTEEHLLASYGYPELSAQEAEHEGYLSILIEFLFAASDGNVDKEKVYRYLLQWWVSHVLVSDMEYKEFLGHRILPG